MCRSGCPTKDHRSYADCCRNSGIRVAYCDSTNRQDYSRQKRWDSELAGYRDAVAEGLEPKGTTWKEIDAARKAADATGVASGVPDVGHVLNSD